MRVLPDHTYFIEGRYMLPKKGSPGGVDTSGLEEATKQATALQKQIYEQTREDVQPWYNMGTGAVGRLSDLLGVAGGSNQSRQQIYNELLPQYTTQQAVSQTDHFIGPDGMVYDLRDPDDLTTYMNRNMQGNTAMGSRTGFATALQNPDGTPSDDYKENALKFGFTPLTTQGGGSTVDYDALNSAIEDRLAGQELPSDYGSLLERFNLSKFEEDPGYQFRQDEATKALERQMAAQGVTIGGAGMGELNPSAYRYMNDLTQNLASQEYGLARDRYVQDNLNTYNMLMGAAGMGQGSTGIMANTGQNYATNVGQLQTGLASAQLNADLSSQAQRGSMFGDLLGAGARVAVGLL